MLDFVEVWRSLEMERRGCLGRCLSFLLMLAVVYVCCRWPDEVVWVLEFGFRLLWMLGQAVVDGVKGLFQPDAVGTVAAV